MDVGGTKGRYEGLFLYVHSIGVGGKGERQDNDDAEPVAERERDAQSDEKSSGVRGMTQPAVGASVDDAVVRLNGDGPGEEPAENAKAVAPEQATGYES